MTKAELGVAAVAGLALLWYLSNAKRVTRAAAQVPFDIAAGAIEGVGEAFGVPVTDQDKCTADLEAGHLWDASFDCPASRFIKEGIF